MSKFTYLAAPYIIRTELKVGMVRLAFDIETDGLLDQATKIHCIVVADLDSDRIDAYGPEQIPAALEHLARADYLVGHNIAGYDLPLLRRLYDWAPASGCTIVDTLIAGRLILPHINDLDKQAAGMGEPKLGKLHGRYSIEAWGARLGMPKVGIDIEGWSTWTPEMQERCASDVAICKALYRFLQPDGYSKPAMELEHRTAAICNQITADGVPFDVKAAERLHQQWTNRRAELKAQLSQQFPGTNLKSRAQIGALLEARGWIPEKRTKKTKQPKIDNALLEAIPAIYPEFAGLAECMLLERRLASLADGKKAWLQHVGEDGRIHGAIVHIGTPHSRAAHFNPNLAQVPNPKRGTPLAVECRALFRHPGDWVFVACDQAGLQDRCFSHYLAEFDGGDYGRAYVAGVDPHWRSATALELVSSEFDKASKLHNVLREGAKSFRYGFLFGMRAKRAGEIIATTIRAARQVDPSYCGPSTNGTQALRRFEAATPGLKQLRQSLETQAARNEWVLGLDGRRVPTGAQYKALNRIVTSAEAIVCKRWLIAVHDELRARFHYGWDGDAVIAAWIHDELAICCRPEIAEQIGDIMLRHANKPGEFYGLKVSLDAGYKISRSWAGEPHSGVEVSDAVLAGHTDSGEPEITHPEPFVLVEPEANHYAPVENPENSGEPPIADETPAEVGDDMIISASPAVSAAIAVMAAVPRGTIAEHRVEPESDSGANGSGKILCPFHEDHTPSLQIYADEDDPHYHCFVCGAHGYLDDLPVDWTAASSPHADDAATLAYAHRLWGQAKPIAGTLAARYLTEVRGIDINALSPDALRFHPGCSFNGSRHPCLLALFRDIETDEPAGIHRIALTPGAQKIDRRMLGWWPRPRAIKLWPAGKHLYLGEGIETVLAAATRLRDRGALMQPAWAAGSSSSIEKFPIVAGVEELDLLVDRDPHGQNAAAACRQTWKAAGRNVRRLQTQDPSLNDFNSLVRAKFVS